MKYCRIKYYHGTKTDIFSKIGVGYITDDGRINPDPIILEDRFRDDSKGRKELLREWNRILNDLKGSDTEIYKERYDGTYELIK